MGQLAKDRAHYQHQLSRLQPDFRFGKRKWPKTERIISISCPGCSRIWAEKLAKDRAHHQHQLPRPLPDLSRGAGRSQSASSASVAQAAAQVGQGSLPTTERIVSISFSQNASSASVANAAAGFGREAGHRKSASAALVAQAAAGFGQGSWPKIKRIISIICLGRCWIWVGKLANDVAHHQHQFPGRRRI